MTSETHHQHHRLTGRHAVVPGATSGIGAVITRALAVGGARVVVAGRDTERGAEVVGQIGAAGGGAVFAPADLAGSYAEVRRFAADATDALDGRVAILVNNAEIHPARSTADLADDDLSTVTPGATLTPGNASARAVVLLTSDDASLVHGATLDVDGGISSTRPS